MNAVFYNFSKKKNSTAIPSNGTTVTVKLKDDTSLYRPVFRLSGAFPNYTYASWNGLYYYVTDIIQINNGLYEAECELDPMASARSDIFSINAFVNRSDSAYDVYMKDVEMSAKQQIVSSVMTGTTLSGFFDGTGCYILRVIGDNAGASGIATFAVSEAELNVILSYMFTDGNFPDVLSDVVVKSIFNPFQYIVSLKYTPIAKSVFDSWGTTQPVNFGWWTGGGGSVRCIDRVGGVYPSSGTPITLGKPSAYFGDFRDYDPEFTEFKLTLPGGNTVTLPSIWLSISNIYVSIVYDIVVGEALMFLHTSSGTLASFPFKCCADVQIGQMNTDVGGLLGDVGGAVGSFICGNPIGVGTSSAGAVANILQPSPSILSQNTAMQSMITYRDPFTTVIRYGSGANYPANFGRVLNDNRTLSTLSGFCKCSGAHVDTDLPEMYKDEIDSMLNSGFFIE